jgi:hypothetical protein
MGGRGKVGIGPLIGLLLAVAGILAFYFNIPTFGSLLQDVSGFMSQTPNGSVINQTLSEPYSVTGNGTTLTKMTFYNANGMAYPATLSSPSSYYITLPNKNATYTVDAIWKGNYSWQGGNIRSTAPFVFDTTSRPNQKLIFLTPDSVILVKGSVNGPKGSWVDAINYSTSAIGNKQVAVSLGGYSMMLPNLATYQVTLIYHYAQDVISGNKDACQAGSLVLNASVGTASISDFRNCTSS